MVNTWASKNSMAFIDRDLQPFAWLKMVNTLGHLFPDPRYYGGTRPYPDVRGHVFLQDAEAAERFRQPVPGFNSLHTAGFEISVSDSFAGSIPLKTAEGVRSSALLASL